jgi:membrane-bound ClpP family serine protease
MKLLLLIAIVGIVTALATVLVAALYHHKKSSTRDIKLLGETAQVDTKLDPEGTVLVRGELWRATSRNGVSISRHTRVRIVGFQEHLLLVEVCD